MSDQNNKLALSGLQYGKKSQIEKPAPGDIQRAIYYTDIINELKVEIVNLTVEKQKYKAALVKIEAAGIVVCSAIAREALK